MIKGYCVVCGKKIPKAQKYYQQHGNYCLDCCGMISKKPKVKEVKKVDLYKKYGWREKEKNYSLPY